MPESKRLTLIIDANNLAHYLDHLAPGQPLTSEEVLRLAVLLSNYARTVQPHITIELCFDPLLPGTPLPQLPWINCQVAAAKSKADDLLRQRFRFHQHHDAPCIVITNDGEIRDDVEAEDGSCLLVYDFVRRPGKSPVFRQPGEFNTVRARREAPVRHRPAEPDWSQLSAPPQEVISPGAKREAGPSKPENITAALDEAVEAKENSLFAEPGVCSGPAFPIYRLSLETWPLDKGLDILLDAFCPAHRDTEEWRLYRSLAAGEIRPVDLCDLAGLLCKCCAGEPDFARQGSLMKRVRLALLQAEDHCLSLGKIAQVTDQKLSGLQGRIREKAAPWVEILAKE